MLNIVDNTMNHNLQKEVGFWIDALIKWQPDMSIIGTLDFYQNICKPQWIDVYKKTILELRANRYDGLANTLETRFEIFQKDVTEREKKRLGTDEQQPGYNQVLNAYKIRKPAHSRSGDVLMAFFDIEISKQHLIDVLKKIAEKKSVVGKIILWVAGSVFASIIGTIITDILGNFGWLKIIRHLLIGR